MDAPEEVVCPYCGTLGKVLEVCSHCGMHANTNQVYMDPIESNWQMGRFLRNLKGRKKGIVYRVIVLILLFPMVLSIAVEIYRFIINTFM